MKIRNKGKDNEYFNVLPIGNKKGINLKDFVFSKYFIELSHNDKLSVISGVDRKNKPRNLELEKEKYKSILDEWYKLRCHEIRYLHPSSKAWKKYKYESSDNKRVIISNYISENNKLRKEYLTSTFGNKRNEEKYNLSSLIKYTHQNRINNEQISFSDSKPLSRKRCGPPPSRRNKLLHLSECDVVYLSRERTEMLLPGDVFDQLSTGRKKRATKWNNNVRWDVHQEGVTVPARYSDNVTNEILKDIAGKKFSSTKTETVDWKLFNHSIDHEAFLDMLSVTHGITRSAYIVTQGRDGSPRIQCGRLKRSINDFLTKELHLEWPEAQDILINERKRQQENNLIKPKLDKSYSYWKEFKNWQSLEGNSYKELWADLRGNHKRQIHAHREQFHLRRRSIYSNTSISWRERRAQLSLLRIEKLACEEKLRLNFKRQKEELKESLLIEVRYLEFLKTKIKSGDKEALAEYRCFAREINKKHINSNGINTLESNNAVLEGYKFTVGTSGNVIYTIKDTEAIEDTPLWVSVIQDEDKDVIELAVRLALEKNYGKPLEITGNESFQQRVVQVVIERGIRADFKDENLDLYRRQYEAAKRKSDDLNHYSINKKQKSKKFNKN
ncbi:LPD7 domain-containing protein [Xenorhabdus nematophila]|uniref:LPD7 domain-containing protein n=1 Tax=Xenorhabdus nematophila TaxID=628 RepID=UPI0032B7707A